MNILFIADPLESFKIYKDTTFAMMREAQRRGHTVAACEPQDVMWQRGDRVTGPCARHLADRTLRRLV
jgi:glutathione synthase